MPDIAQARIESPEVASALDDVLGAAGFAPEPVPLTIAGHDPVLPTNYLFGAVGSAALSAIGLAAADLWRLRTGRTQSVALDVAHACAAIRTSKYLRRDGAASDVFNAGLSGFYPARDGRWFHLHTSFPHHLQGTIDLLGCASDRAAAAEKVADWDAEELELALYARGCVGAVVRSRSEWQAHPHSAAVDRLPLLEIVRIGDAPPEPLPDGDRPLSGIRALDLTRVLAGPTCGRTLAEHGAEVMRIGAAKMTDSDENVMDTGHGKLNAYLDLDVPEEKARLLALAREADVFTQAYRHPGLPAGQPGGAGPVAGGPGARASGHRLRDAVGLRPRGAVGDAARLRQPGALRHRHDLGARLGRRRGRRGRAGRGRDATPQPGAGARLRHRLPDGVRRDGRARPPRARGRKLDGAPVAGADGALDPRPRTGEGHRRTHRRRPLEEGDRAPVDRERHAVRPAAPPGAGAAPVGDAAALGQAGDAARDA
ncbi:MAG: CoA transferase [Acetobacterales bacterium]